jgi:hypothetical protein
MLARSWPLGARSQDHTEQDDGLHQPWEGLVFMNPPFGGRNGHIPWLRKFLEHANGIAIVRAYTPSAWFHRWAIKAEMMLFPKGKTKFVRPDGSIGRTPGAWNCSARHRVCRGRRARRLRAGLVHYCA